MRISDWSSDVCSSDLVGKKSVEFIHNADGFIVRTHIRLTVTFLSMTIYRFEHDAVETWAMGRLTNFVSHSNDDGKSRDVEMAAEGDRLVGIYNGKPADVPGDIIPASLWHPGTVNRSEEHTSELQSLMRSSYA